MCAILDANAASQVFHPGSCEAGQIFLEWVEAERGRLVIGGKLKEELDRTKAQMWLKEAISAGIAKNFNVDEINTEEKKLRKKCKSDDSHVIALARISGARLLYSHDERLHEDFKNKKLIYQPRGKIYSDASHQPLLNQRDLCRAD